MCQRHLDDMCRACLENRDVQPLTQEEEQKNMEFGILVLLPDQDTKFYAVVGPVQGFLFSKNPGFAGAVKDAGCCPLQDISHKDGIPSPSPQVTRLEILPIILK